MIPVTGLDNTRPFGRVYVDYYHAGTSTITWELEPRFYAPSPLSFQVQEAESDVDAGNWVAVGAPVIGTTVVQVPDATLRLPAGKESNVFYRVQLTDGAGTVYYSDPASIFGHLPIHLWRFVQEIVRKETLRASQLLVSNEGFLLKAKRSGTPCTACTDPNGTDEQTDSECPTCFGQRFVGGYYTAQASFFSDNAPLGHYAHHDLQGRGQVDDDEVTQGRVLAFPYLSTYDIFVDKTSDIRFFIHRVKTLAHLRMVPIVQQVELRQIPFSHIVYKFPAP